jgi:hypothetical protein
VNITILGSCRFSPYNILAVPNPIEGLHNTDDGYRIASLKFYPAISNSDLVIAYIPDGIGKHTQLDIDYANFLNKRIVFIK